MSTIESWTITGADDQPIIGNTHLPDGEARGVLIIAHGFKGYKDYGMFPHIAAHVSSTPDNAQGLPSLGFIAHRFNFSHSGMTNNTATFERPDLFERDTWNKQVFDVRRVIEAIENGELAGKGMPHVLLGHSRGGVTVLLTAGRFADDQTLRQPAGVISIAAPDRCNTLSEDEQRTVLAQGYLDSPSNRTGQALRVGKTFLQEMLDDPAGHDLLALVSRIRCPMLILHGEDDPTVDASCAKRIADAATAAVKAHTISGADHVMNTPNPMPADAEPSAALQTALDEIASFLRAVSEGKTSA
jgi:uncharacterized protein